MDIAQQFGQLGTFMLRVRTVMNSLMRNTRIFISIFMGKYVLVESAQCSIESNNFLYKFYVSGQKITLLQYQY